MQIDRLAMNSMLISQCRICKQEDFRKCASVVRGILAPFPDRESLNDKGKDLCPVCQQIIDIQYAYCFDCKDRKLGALSSLDFIGYHSPPDPFNLIKKGWQSGYLWVFRPLGALVADLLLQNGSYEKQIITCVPSHHKIRKTDPVVHILRQANLLSHREIQTRYDLAGNIIENTQNGSEQKSRNRKERSESGFRLAKRLPDLAGRSMLLFDDVYTTGQSMQKCAELLINAGAQSVHGFALARTLSKQYRSDIQANLPARCVYFRS